MGHKFQGGGQTSTSYIPMTVALHLGHNTQDPTWTRFIIANPVG